MDEEGGRGEGGGWALGRGRDAGGVCGVEGGREGGKGGTARERGRGGWWSSQNGMRGGQFAEVQRWAAAAFQRVSGGSAAAGASRDWAADAGLARHGRSSRTGRAQSVQTLTAGGGRGVACGPRSCAVAPPSGPASHGRATLGAAGLGLGPERQARRPASGEFARQARSAGQAGHSAAGHGRRD